MSTSLPRPLLIALLGTVAVAGVFLLTRGGSDQAAAPPAPAPAPETSAPAPSGTAAPPAAGRAEPGRSAADRPRRRTLPAPVQRALDANKVLVLLFWNPRGVDDRSVKSAVDGLSRGSGKVAVFSDRPKNLARYTKITAGVDVTQTPTLVVVDRQGEARKATGYLDPDTVEQYVVDALHGAP
jgi:hypothetical protein